MMFAEAIERARSRCRTVLLEQIARRKSEGRSVIVEPLPRLASGEVAVAPDGLQLPLRYDLVYRDDSDTFQPENADSVTIEFPEPVFASWEHKLRIEIHRLCWDYLRVEVSPCAASTDWEPLRRWFLKWCDPEERHPQSTDGVNNVAHFVSDPEVDGDVGRLFVDLGSAPNDALGELFDELIALGFTTCVIGRKEMA